MGETHKLLIAVTKPPWTCRVRGVSLSAKSLFSLSPTLILLTEHVGHPVTVESSGDVAIVDKSGQLFGVHISEQFPEWFLSLFRFDVPEGVHNGTNRHVHDAFFWPEPPQLRVPREFEIKRTHVVKELVEIPSKDIGA